MTTIRSSALSIRPLALLTGAVFTLFGLPSTASAQNDTVTVSTGEFQRMVYSANLLAEVAEKPELDASLQVLLELHRRNQHADAAALAGVLTNALDRYRSNAPAHLRAHGGRDEILAAYLEALGQIPAYTNFVPAQLSLLNDLLTRRRPPSGRQQADLLHSGSQTLLSSEGVLAQRQALLDACTDRAWSHAGFRAAMEALLWLETHTSLENSPAEIINNPNSALHDNTTMRTLLAFSAASGGSLTVSSNQLLNLFTNETQTFWDTINTNLALQLEINQSQPDLLAYLTNRSAIVLNEQRLAEVKQGQARKIASATAAILVQSKLIEANNDPLIKLPGQMQGVVEGLHMITDGLAAFGEKDATKFAKIAASGNILAGGFEILNLFTGGEQPEEEMAREIGNIKRLLGDLSTNMNYRFDRVDQSLTTIFDTLKEQFDQITNYFNATGRQICELKGDANAIRLSLLDVQTDLSRIERNLATFQAEDLRDALVAKMNVGLGYEASSSSGRPMAYDLYNPNYVVMATDFYTYAHDTAGNPALARYTTLPYGTSPDQHLYFQLSPAGTTNVYAETLNYIKQCLRQRLSLSPAFPEKPILVNPQDWNAGANAFLQLALENPDHFRRYDSSKGYPEHLDGIIGRGRELTDFFRSLTFTGSSINTSLYAALEGFYLQKLVEFTDQMRSLERAYGAEHGFAVDTWRQWSATVPRVNAAATEILFSPFMALPPIPRDTKAIAAGARHSLALRANGTVVGWGDHTSGQTRIPEQATNVLAISAGLEHSLVLCSNGVIVAWGSNAYGQTNAPLKDVNFSAISAGHYHSLALRSDGVVLAWGAGTNSGTFPNYGQSQVPNNATNIIAVAAGGYHSLALRADGAVMAWGLNNEGQLAIPSTATNVVAIAAGHGHNLALKADGTLVAWGNNRYNGIAVGTTNVPVEATNIVAIAAAGWHCLALRDDGRLFAWGLNGQRQCIIPPAASRVQAVAAGFMHSLALKPDGTVVAWGANDSRQSLVPPALSWEHSIVDNPGALVALRPNGTVQCFEAAESEFYRPEVPLSATNIVSLAAGKAPETHFLALREDGTLVGWGDNFYGQQDIPMSATNVIRVSAGKGYSVALRGNGTVVSWGNNACGQTNVPPGLSNVVTIVSGDDHNLALCADGKLVAWGSMTNIPAGLSNVVALAAGRDHNLVLRSDGTVVGWGSNTRGQTNIHWSLTNVIAITAGDGVGLALRSDGSVALIGSNSSYQYGPFDPRNPTGLGEVAAIGRRVVLKTNGELISLERLDHPFAESPEAVSAIAAGAYHNLALPLGGKHRGRVHGWGDNTYDQATGAVWPDPIPPEYPKDIVELYLHDYFVGMGSPRPYVVTNVISVAAGEVHSLALRADGTVVAWGDNGYAQTSVPDNLNHVLAIAAGGWRSLALKADGTVVNWGYGAKPPPTATNVMEIAVGWTHTLALRADGKVVAWGDNTQGQTNVPPDLTNVVALAAGGYHSLALKADGTIVGWGAGQPGTSGLHDYAQATIPPGLSNVVAIAAGHYHSLALKSDGTAVGWGDTYRGQALVPAGATNLIAIAAGRYHSLFLKETASAGPVVEGGPFLVRGHVPARLGDLLRDVNSQVRTELDFDLHNKAIELSGAKALFRAVIELAMPYTLEHDDVLRGFLYGSEPLMDLNAASTFLQSQNGRLEARSDVRPHLFGEVSALRFQRFKARLDRCLSDLQDAGQPELPRLVEHTLRMLNLLRETWATTAPPVLDLSSGAGSRGLIVHGEPYAHYTLQYSDTLKSPTWSSITVTNLLSGTIQTNLHSQDIFSPTSQGPSGFYRAALFSP